MYIHTHVYGHVFWLVDVGGSNTCEKSPPIFVIMIQMDFGFCNWSQVEFQDTMEQGYPAGERAIEGFLIHYDYGALAPPRIIPFLVEMIFFISSGKQITQQ